MIAGSTTGPNVTNPQGDVLNLVTTIPAAATPDPNNPGSYLLNCSGNGPAYGGEAIGFCGYIQVFDSVSGNQTTTSNTQADSVYDACGTLVHSGSTFGWHVVGTNYLVSGWIGSLVYFVPTSGVCWGQWTETYSFSETFTDGQTLTDSLSDAFFVYPVNPAPPTAYGYGNGDASVHNPTCNGGDPVNCASGNFSETFVDATVPGRGPRLDLTRTYNSLSASTPGIFGYGWSSSYEAHVTLNGDGSATVTEDDGSQVTGTPAGGGTYTIPPWANSTLTRGGDGTWTFVRRRETTFTFDSTGRLTALSDRNGNSTHLSYNGSGQLATVTDAAGRTLTFTFGSNGFVSQVADPLNQVTSYGYDPSGNLTSVTDPMTRTTSFGYDGSHLLQTVTDPRQGVTTNVYDSSGRVTQQTDPANLLTRFAYSGDNFSTSGGTTTITDPHGNVTVQSYASGVMLSATKGSGTAAAGTWNYGYDANTFGLTSVTDPNGHVTRSTYDSAGNLLTSADALNRTTTYTYNSFNEPLTVTDPAGVKTTYTYDANGNALTKVVTGVGGTPTATTPYSYTDGHAGELTEVTDPAGHVTDYTYDSQGDVATATTHPSPGVNHTTAFIYDRLGRKVCEASPVATAAGIQCPPAGQPRVAGTTTRTYDADNELTSLTDPLGNVTSYGYDADGNKSQVTDPVGNVTRTTFDPDSRATAVTTGYGTPAASTISYGYDIAPGTGTCSISVSAATYCTSSTDPGGAATITYFNSRDERIRQTQPSSGTTTSTYDPAGNLSTRATNGGTTTYGYDADNELSSLTYSAPGSGFTAAANVSYAYDVDGHRTSMTDGTGHDVELPSGVGPGHLLQEVQELLVTVPLVAGLGDPSCDLYVTSGPSGARGSAVRSGDQGLVRSRPDNGCGCRVGRVGWAGSIGWPGHHGLRQVHQLAVGPPDPVAEHAVESFLRGRRERPGGPIPVGSRPSGSRGNAPAPRGAYSSGHAGARGCSNGDPSPRSSRHRPQNSADRSSMGRSMRFPKPPVHLSPSLERTGTLSCARSWPIPAW